MYVKNRPKIFDQWFRSEVEEYNVPCFLNLRNDDMFVLRWGNPDFVRNYIQEMPHDVSPGFYMGSDGYVWGREFIAKNPKMAGRLEIDKHWYRMRQWGQLAMALPCIFLLLRADFHTEHEENIINLYPALKYCSG